MASDLPTEFDVIILGTGMPESIVAAAFSRIGQRVLHIDKNDFYSAEWSAFNLEGLNRLSTKPDPLTHPDIDRDAILKEGETLLPLDLKTLMNASDLNIKFHVEDADVSDKESSEGNTTSPGSNLEDVSDSSDAHCEKLVVPSEAGTPKDVEKHEVKSDDEKSEEVIETVEIVKSVDDRFADAEEPAVELGDKCGSTDKGESVSTQKDKCSSKKEPEVWSASRIRKEWRRFNLDLAPRLLYSAGSMVELLITSDVAKYCEFKTVTRVLTKIGDELKPVPCSRSDIFNSKDITMAEKRILMKFLMTCVKQDQEDPSGKTNDSSQPFIEFLKSQKLTDKILHYVLYAIAMAKPTDTTVYGMTRVRKFLQSLGRYGNTAFLWPLYGSGELPQSFCRLCAVFGGTYCLRLSASALVIDANNTCTGIITTQGQRIDTKWLVMGATFAPEDYLKDERNEEVSRAILLTEESVLHADGDELSLLHLPCSEDGDNPVTVLELPASSMACPQSLHVVHLTRVSQNGQSPEQNLSVAVDTLFSKSDDDGKPKILWSAYFGQKNLSGVRKAENVPKNVFLMSGPGAEIDLDCIVSEAKDVFEHILPVEEFLPRPPNPEDIIYVDNEEATVGESTPELDNKEEEANNSSDKEDESVTNVTNTTDSPERCEVPSSGEVSNNAEVLAVSADTEVSSEAEVSEMADGDKTTCLEGCVAKMNVQELTEKSETRSEQ